MKTKISLKKTLFVFLLFVTVSSQLCLGQSNSEEAVKNLTHIVDSLHNVLQAQVPKTYYAYPQGVGHLFTFKGENIEDVYKAIMNEVPWDTLKKQYPITVIKENAIFVEREQEANKFELRAYEIELVKKVKVYSESLVDNKTKSKYLILAKRPPSLSGIYFTQPIEKQVIPAKYAKMRQYASFMIPNQEPIITGQERSKDIKLYKQSKPASKEANLELYNMLRSYHAGQGCGQDTRPAKQLMDISYLAGELGDWDIFIRAKLESLRRSRRGLPKIDFQVDNLNVPHFFLGLLIGECEGYKHNYYFHWAGQPKIFFDTIDKEDIKKLIFEAIKDSTLDVYNRYQLGLLYTIYVRNIKDKVQYQKEVLSFEKTIADLPESLQEALNKNITRN